MTLAPEAADTDSLTWLRDDAEWAAIRTRLRAQAEATPVSLPSIDELLARGDKHFIVPQPGETWESFHLRVRTEEALLAWLVAFFSA